MEDDHRRYPEEDDRDLFRIYSTEVKERFVVCRGEYNGADETILVSYNWQEEEQEIDKITLVQLARVEKLPDGNTVGSSIQIQLEVKEGQTHMTAAFGPFVRGITEEDVTAYMGTMDGLMPEHYRNAEFTQSKQQIRGKKYFTVPPIVTIVNGGAIDEIDETDRQFVVRPKDFHDDLELKELFFPTHDWTKLGERFIAITPQEDKVTLQLVTQASPLNSPDKNTPPVDVIQTMTFLNTQVTSFYPSQMVEEFMVHNMLNIHDSDDNAELMQQMVAYHSFFVTELGYTTSLRPRKKTR